MSRKKIVSPHDPVQAVQAARILDGAIVNLTAQVFFAQLQISSLN